MPAPYLRRLVIKDGALSKNTVYHFDLPWLHRDGFELEFTTPVTIIAGENGSGKSTLIEAIAWLAGFTPTGGGPNRDPRADAEEAETSRAQLADALQPGWLPKVSTGWFFRAETFFTVAQQIASDYLSWSHGEGFLRIFSERMSAPGLYLMDEPESALAPERQFDLLRQLHRIQTQANAQVIMATHSPTLMAVPGARLLQIRRDRIDEAHYQDTRHFRLYRSFTLDPEAMIAEALAREDDDLF
nr:AAA family ATPase [Actibacterium sp. 188UL27-1]